MDETSSMGGFNRQFSGSKELMFQSVWENSADGMRLTDETGTVIDVNEAYCSMMKMPRAKLIGANFSIVYHPSLRGRILKKYVERFRSRTVETNFERRLRLASGKEIDVEVTNSMIDFRNGNSLALAIFRNISERKRAEAALLESEERYRRITAAVTDYIFIVYIENGSPVRTVHGAACIGITGYTAEEFAADPYLWFTMVFPEDRERVEKHASRILTDKSPVALEHRIRRKDGEVRWVSNIPVPHFDSTGTLISYDGLIRDITERRQAEDALRENEENMRYILKHDPNAIAVYDNNLHYLVVSDRYLRDYGIKEKDIIGKHHYEVFPEMPQRWKDVHQRVLADAIERNDDDYFVRPDGSITYNRWECRPWYRADGRIGGMITYTEVTTERKLAEMALRESEKKFSSIFQHAPLMITISTLEDGTYLDVNQEFVKVSGFSQDEAVGHNSIELGGIKPEIRRQLAEMLKIQGRVSNFELELFTRDRRSILCLYHGELIDLNGRTRLLSIAQDISERKRAEVQLREKTHLSQILLDAFPCVALLLRPQTREIINSNAAAIRVGAIPGTHCFRTWGQREDACPWCLAPELWATGKPEHLEVEASGVIWDAHWIPVAEDLYMHFAFDITEQRKMEEKIIEAQKMDSIGNLAGGVAHDFNNMLGGIMGYASLLLMDESEPGKIDSLQGIVNSAQRASQLTQQLLAFGRRGKNLNQAIGLNLLIEEVFAIIGRTMPKEIILERRLAENLHTIDGDPTQITQVVLNLCVNAKEAMPGGGILTVESGNIALDDAAAGKHPNIRPGEYVLLSVSDTGGGISDEIRKYLFEPFFTTKTEGAIKGSGLGLPVVYGVVRSHGGFIDLVTAVGKGTTFRVYFPRGAKRAAQEAAAEKEAESGKGTILIIDDEESIRRLAKTALTRLGYSILLAKDGQEGVQIYREKHTVINAVILDMQMPKMGGRQAFKCMKEINPDIRAILCTGFGQNEQAQEIMDMGIRTLLAKPYTIRDLSHAVIEALRK